MDILEILLCAIRSREREIDDAVWFLAPPMVLPILGVVVDEGDELDIAPILEADQLVLCFAVCMPAAGREGEMLRDPRRWVAERGVRDEDDDVIEGNNGGHTVGLQSVWEDSSDSKYIFNSREEALLEKTKAGFRIDTVTHIKVRNCHDIVEEEDIIVYEAFQ